MSEDGFFELAAEMRAAGPLRADNEHALWIYASIERLLRSVHEPAAAEAIHAVWARTLASAEQCVTEQQSAPQANTQSEPRHIVTRSEQLGTDVTVVAHYPLEDGPECISALLALLTLGQNGSEA